MRSSCLPLAVQEDLLVALQTAASVEVAQAVVAPTTIGNIMSVLVVLILVIGSYEIIRLALNHRERMAALKGKNDE